MQFVGKIDVQIYNFTASVCHVIFHDEDFAPELRATLRDLLAEVQVEDLRMELAIVKDVGKPLVQLCYHQEGDSALLCATTYDHWEEVRGQLTTIVDPNIPVQEKIHLLPSVLENVNAIGGTQQQINDLIRDAAERARPAAQ